MQVSPDGSAAMAHESTSPPNYYRAKYGVVGGINMDRGGFGRHADGTNFAAVFDGVTAGGKRNAYAAQAFTTCVAFLVAAVQSHPSLTHFLSSLAGLLLRRSRPTDPLPSSSADIRYKSWARTRMPWSLPSRLLMPVVAAVEAVTGAHGCLSVWRIPAPWWICSPARWTPATTPHRGCAGPHSTPCHPRRIISSSTRPCGVPLEPPPPPPCPHACMHASCMHTISPSPSPSSASDGVRGRLASGSAHPRRRGAGSLDSPPVIMCLPLALSCGAAARACARCRTPDGRRRVAPRRGPSRCSREIGVPRRRPGEQGRRGAAQESWGRPGRPARGGWCSWGQRWVMRR